MGQKDHFLTKAEEAEVVDAILRAEGHTSGEIRVHIEEKSPLTPMDRAKELFHFLKMDNTKQENGVLIYVAVADKKFAIYGDRGIDKVVADDFWDLTRDAIQSQFRSGNFKQGLIDGVLAAGRALEAHFPWDESDTNELSNEISKG